jgi:hypothetical protein
MKLIRSVDEAEMVSAFLQADYHAPRPEPRECACAALGADAEALILQPNRQDLDENDRRRRALVRSRNELRMLFQVCPSLEWKLVVITHEELGRFRLLGYRTFCQLAPQTRTVREAALNVDHPDVEVDEDLKGRIAALETALRRTPSPHPPLIAVAQEEAALHVILDGNTRAVAYFRSRSMDSNVEVIVGYHAGVVCWEFFGSV